jgi:hypothetical protein
LDFPWLGKCGVLFLLDLYIYFGFPLARLKWRILLKSVRLPLQSSMAAYRTVSAYGHISTAGLWYQIGCHPSERNLNTVTLNTNRMHRRWLFAPIIVQLNITGKLYCDGRMTRIFCDQRYGIRTCTITAVQPSHTVTVRSPNTKYSNQTSK